MRMKDKITAKDILLAATLAGSGGGGGITPTGTKAITIRANGTTTENVAEYENARITVAVPEPGMSWAQSIYENGTYTYDVKRYATMRLTVDVAGSGGGAAGLLEGSAMEYTDEEVKALRPYAFYYNGTIQSVSLPNVVSIGEMAFQECHALQTVDLPAAQYLEGSGIFQQCGNLYEVNLPLVESIPDNTFAMCSSLQRLVMPKCTDIGEYAFANCGSLGVIDIYGGGMINTALFGDVMWGSSKLIIRCEEYVTKINESWANTLSSVDVYVPDKLLDEYKKATLWCDMADKIHPISEYVEEW